MPKNNDIRIFVGISTILHLIFLYVAVIGLPFLARTLPEEMVISVEMLPVSDISNVKTQKSQKEKAIKTEQAKKTQKSIKPTEEEKPKEKEPEKVKEEKPEEEKPKEAEQPKEEIKPQEEKPKEEPKPKEEEKPKEKTPKEEAKPKQDKPQESKAKKEKPKEVKSPKKDEPKPKKKKKTPDVDALLKTLEQSSDGNNPKASEYNREEKNDIEHDAFGNFNEDMPLSISEKSLIKEQIRKNWNISMIAGVRNAEQIIITLALTFDISGEVKSAKIVSMQCPSIDATTCQAVADSAVRATYLASPLEGLPRERYYVWKELNFAFTPID